MRKEEKKERMRKVRKKESEGGREGGRKEGKRKGEREAREGFIVSSSHRYTKQLLLSTSHIPFQTAHGLGYLLREGELWHR